MIKNATLLMVCLLLTLAPAATAAPLGDPFAVIEGTCPKGSYKQFTGGPVPERHADVVVRYEIGAGEGSVDGNPGRSGDVMWESHGGFERNDLPRVSTSCDESTADMPFTARFFDEPATPASFDGMGGASEITFKAAGLAEYVAEINVASGTLEVQYGRRIQRFTGRGEFMLGRLYRGEGTRLSLSGVDSRPGWSIRVRALPVTMSASFSKPFLNASGYEPPTVNLEASGDTDVSIDIVDHAGQPVRRLVDSKRISSEKASFSWDGSDATGARVPDGPYKALVAATDPAGHTQRAEAAITVDRTDPVIRVLTRKVILETEPVVAEVSDAATGVAKATLREWIGSAAVALLPGGRTMSLRPLKGWEPGSRTVKVDVADGAGNGVEVRHEFTVVKGQPCTAAAAKKAIPRDYGVMTELRRGRLIGERSTRGLRVVQVACGDLTADGPKEMAVLVRGLRKRTAVVVFALGDEGWEPQFRSAKHRFRRLAIKDGVLEVHVRGGRRALKLVRRGKAFKLG